MIDPNYRVRLKEMTDDDLDSEYESLYERNEISSLEYQDRVEAIEREMDDRASRFPK